MNKLMLLLISCAVLILQSGCGTGPEKETKDSPLVECDSTVYQNFCNLTIGEAPLNFGTSADPDSNVYLYSLSQLNAGLSNFYTNFRFDNAGSIVSLDSSTDQLSVTNISALYDVVKTDPVVRYTPASDYSGLRMLFGMEGKKIKLIYEPVVMKPTPVAREYTVVGTGRYYTSRLAGLEPISNTDAAVLMDAFRNVSSSIYIIHPDNPVVKKFINTDSSTGDIRSNIMSFQEIVKMYCDNTSTVNYSDMINCTIVADKMLPGSANYKMHVVPNYKIGLSVPLPGTFQSFGADFSQLCPVNCTAVYLNTL